MELIIASIVNFKLVHVLTINTCIENVFYNLKPNSYRITMVKAVHEGILDSKLFGCYDSIFIQVFYVMKHSPQSILWQYKNLLFIS